MSAAGREYVSRAGEKLDALIRHSGQRVAGCVCIDFGSHVGGFVDCLLRHGAARVYAVEPGYGVLDARLRADPRVRVCERQNALRYTAEEPAQVISADVGWTPIRLVLPTIRRCLTPDGAALLLIKPHYEADRRLLKRGVLPDAHLPAVLATCRADARDAGAELTHEIESPLRGHGGNREFLWRLSFERPDASEG